jgi:hypothetical protein
MSIQDFPEMKISLATIASRINEAAEQGRRAAAARHEAWLNTKNNEEEIYKSALSKLTTEELEVVTARILNTDRMVIINKKYKWFNDKTIMD